MTLMFLGILLLLISWSFVLGIFRTWWMSRIWSFGSQAPQNRQIAQRRRRNREVLEKQQTLYKSQIANHRVQQPAQLEDPNRLLNTESTLSRRQAAQRIRRNRELAEKAEGEFQRRSLGQTLRQHRELQQANANRGTETTGQVFGVTTPRDNSRKRKGKAIARHQQDKLCSHNSGNRCKRAMGISISSNSNSSHDRTIDEEFYEIGSTDDEVVSDNETESATALSQDTGAHANSCLYPNVRHSLGSMNVKCRDCGALHFMDERLTKSSPKNPLFGSCCLEGRIRLPNLREPPQQLKELYEGTHKLARLFRRCIRRYNSCNAFTSLGCTLRPRELKGKGPPSFTIHGELRHRTGTLLPEKEDHVTYSQLYIYDPSAALSKPKKDNPMLDEEVLKIIQEVLLKNNAFVQKYKQAYDILKEVPSTENDVYVSLQYKSDKDKRRYNLPTIDEVSVILPGDGTIKSGVRDIVLHLKGSHYLERINECHPAYLPLHYVLLFPYGELSWKPDMVRWMLN